MWPPMICTIVPPATPVHFKEQLPAALLIWPSGPNIDMPLAVLVTREDSVFEIKYVLAGHETVPAKVFTFIAALMADCQAAVESLVPVGSAPHHSGYISRRLVLLANETVPAPPNI